MTCTPGPVDAVRDSVAKVVVGKRDIVDLLLEHTRRRLHAQDVTLEVSDAAADLLANLGYQPDFGARPLRRTIQREVDNQLSRLLLDGRITEGGQVTVDVEGNRLVFNSQNQSSTAH